MAVLKEGRRSRPPSGLVLYVKLVLTAIFWGGTFVAGRIAALEVGPFSAAFLRFLFATVFLFAFLTRSIGRIPTVERRMLFPLALLGLTGVFTYNVLFFAGLKTIPAGRASLIIATNPAFIFVFSCFFFREPAGITKSTGVLLSLVGAAVVISRGSPTGFLEGQLGWGELCIFGCVVSWVAYSLIGKSVMNRVSPLVAVSYACAMGALALFIPALFEGIVNGIADYSPSAWLAIAYLGFFGSALGFSWYYEGIKEIGPSRAGIFINIVPLSSVVLAYLILAEPLEHSLILGALLVVMGVTLMNAAPAGMKGQV